MPAVSSAGRFGGDARGRFDAVPPWPGDAPRAIDRLTPPILGGNIAGTIDTASPQDAGWHRADDQGAAPTEDIMPSYSVYLTRTMSQVIEVEADGLRAAV